MPTKTHAAWREKVVVSQYNEYSQATAQFVTTPLDIVRNRRMMRAIEDQKSLEEQPSYIGTLINIQQTEGVGGLFKGASPRIAKSIVSGALQFAAYEETKQSISRILQGGSIRGQ